LKISKMLKIFIPLFVFFSVSTFISILIFTSAIDKSATTINLQAEYKQIGFDILNSLDRLTRLAVSYSQSGQKSYYDEYLYEFYAVNTKGKTITQLKELGLAEDELAMIYRVMGYSNELAEIEVKAFKAVENGNFEQARRLLFGEKYNDRRHKITTTIKDFQTSVNNQAEIEVNRSREVFLRMFIITIILVSLTIMTAIASFVIIANKIKAIYRLTEIAKEVTNGDLNISIMSDAKDELGDLTRSFGVMLDTIKSITTDLTYIARTDTLTQVANRHSFLSHAPSFFDFHTRADNPVTLLFFDIDDFKNINDNYGHSFGDDVLKNFAKVVSDLIRSFDLFCRYGGEEFILLLANTDQERGVCVAERIMKSLEEAVFPERPDFKYTTSIGIYSAIPQRGETVQDYIDKADLVMYLAKKKGKNRIEIYKEKKD